MAKSHRTVAPFAPPAEFQKLTGRKNGGLRGIRCMKEAEREARVEEANLEPGEWLEYLVGGRFASRLQWLQARAVELYQEATDLLAKLMALQSGAAAFRTKEVKKVRPPKQRPMYVRRPAIKRPKAA